jgi:hypothetical protein
MTDKELELFALAIRYAYSLDQCCPEVGMGPSHYSLALDMADNLSFPVTINDISRAALRAEQQC